MQSLENKKPLLTFPCLLFFSSHRYQYYLQLKKDILEGNIPCTLEQAIHLAGLAVQGE